MTLWYLFPIVGVAGYRKLKWAQRSSFARVRHFRGVSPSGTPRQRCLTANDRLGSPRAGRSPRPRLTAYHGIAAGRFARLLGSGFGATGQLPTFA